MSGAVRSSVEFQVNDRHCEVVGRDVFLTVSEYVRERLSYTGTKIACEEGDCGSCTVLIGKPTESGIDYRPVNSCIRFVFQLDGCHLVTIEALAAKGQLTPVQQAMIDCHGSQCGFCTPGFVMAITAACHKRARPPGDIQPVDWPVELAGNLCRCTGYLPILEAARSCERLDGGFGNSLSILEVFQDKLAALRDLPFDVSGTHHGNRRRVLSPVTLEDALGLRAEQPEAQIIAGATDVGVRWTKAREAASVWIDLARVAELKGVTLVSEDGACLPAEEAAISEKCALDVGAMATWTELLQLAEIALPEFAALLQRFGGPQIRNAGTIGGNLVNASSVADSLPLLCVMDASLELASCEERRWVKVNQFFTANRSTVLRDDELLVRVRIPLPSPSQRLRLYKVSRRHDLDIATMTAAICMKVEAGSIMQAAIAVGGAGPRVRRLEQVEAWLIYRPCNEETFTRAGEIAVQDVSPWSDVRGSAEYRRQLVRSLVVRYFHEMESDIEDDKSSVRNRR